MVEIALSLAIIAFALVAIIGVLPAGLSVQKDNREQTIINLDAAYLMSALRSGPLGQDNLTNYIVSITQTNWSYQLLNGTVQAPARQTYEFTTNQTTLIATTQQVSYLTNGFNIIGLLSEPKYSFIYNSAKNVQFRSNIVTAVFRAINAPAVDQGVSQTSKDFAFQYQVTIEIVPSSEYAFPASTNNLGWLNFTAPTFTKFPQFNLATEAFAQNLQANLYDIRLTFRWPVLANGQVGGGKQVFRSSVAGSYLTSSPPLPPLPALLRNDALLFNPVPSYGLSFPNTIVWFYFMQAGNYQAQL